MINRDEYTGLHPLQLPYQDLCRIHVTQIQISRLLVKITHTIYYGHRVIFYTSSKKWGRDKTLVGASIRNWTQWSDQTNQDILDYIYLDRVTFLEDGNYIMTGEQSS